MKKQLAAGIAAGILFLGSIYGSACAEVQHIEATGSYVIGDNENENIADAKQKAKDAALRAAVEKAGVYVESYSEVKNMKLTADEIKVISGQVLKIDKVEFHPVVGEDGVSITYTCTIEATVDTDKIDLQEKMKQHELSEKNESYKQRIKELEAENKRLREQYDSAQKAEQSVLANQIKDNEIAINKEMKDGYKDKAAYISSINAATSDLNSLEGISIGTQFYAMTSRILPYLQGQDWHYKINSDRFGRPNSITLQREFLNKPYVSQSVNCSLADHKTIKDIETHFVLPNEKSAHELYKLAYTNISTQFGMPSDGDITADSAAWTNNGIRLRIYTYKNTLFVHREKLVTLAKPSPAKLEPAERFLKRREGIWYDSHGNIVLVITPYTINDCPVLGVYGKAGGNSTGYVRIQENNDVRDLHLTDIGSLGAYQLLDDNIGLRKTKEVNYVESINGVYLGCDIDEVKSLLGEPDKEYKSYSENVLRYNRLGMDVAFKGNLVDRIKVENGYPWKFDKSGFTSNGTFQELLDAYNVTLKSSTATHFRIENQLGKNDAGEFIWFNNFPESLELNLFSN